MRFVLIILALFLVSFTTMAKGKFMFEPYANQTTHQDGLKLGLAVNEKIMGPVQWNNFTGMGMDKEAGLEHTAQWLVFRNGIVFTTPTPLQVELGVSFNKGKDHFGKWQAWEQITYLKLSVDLWQ